MLKSALSLNRAPIGGVITDITYQKGQFLVASREVASAQNEQNIVTIRAEDGTKVVYKQIAGLIARRILCYKKVGDVVQSGERVGMIKFGSRTDVIFPLPAELKIKPGERAVVEIRLYSKEDWIAETEGKVLSTEEFVEHLRRAPGVE